LTMPTAWPGAARSPSRSTSSATPHRHSTSRPTGGTRPPRPTAPPSPGRQRRLMTRTPPRRSRPARLHRARPFPWAPPRSIAPSPTTAG
jgi:hypothetical protein